MRITELSTGTTRRLTALANREALAAGVASPVVLVLEIAENMLGGQDAATVRWDKLLDAARQGEGQLPGAIITVFRAVPYALLHAYLLDNYPVTSTMLALNDGTIPTLAFSGGEPRFDNLET